MSVSKAVSWLVNCDGIDNWCSASLEFTYADPDGAGGLVGNQRDVLRATRNEGWEVHGDGTTYCPLHRSRSPEPAPEPEEWEDDG